MKKIILCFDGTGNEPKDADQDNTWFGFGEPEDNSISNVLKLHLLLGGDLQKTHVIGDQMSFYYSGVGTYGNWFEKLKNSFSAPPEEDVGKIIKMGMRDLYNFYRPGDQIYVFGFSRGAAIARRFASVLSSKYEAFGWESSPKITFMGVFDTVAALKKPNLFKEEIKPASDVVFENGTIAPNIEKALHLLSIDERRIAFMPTLMNRDPRVTEVWFSGAHSDVGGGYRYDGLSDNTLEFMIDYIQSDNNLALEFLSAASIDFKELFENGKELIRYEDVVVSPNLMGKNHEQSAITKVKETFLDYRSPRINVSDTHSVYVPIIHRSVFDRMILDSDYNPKALNSYLNNPYTGKNVGIRVWEYDHSCSEYAITPEEVKKGSNIQARTLDVGESRTFTVSSNIKYNRTGVYVGNTLNESYQFVVDMDQKWYDATIECGPKGWDRNNDSLNFITRQFSHFMEGNRRCPDADWFEIIGTIGKNDRQNFRILKYSNGNAAFKPMVKGELFTYANDLMSKYGNNRGSIKVTIKRVG